MTILALLRIGAILGDNVLREALADSTKAELFRGLGDQSRLAILQSLAEGAKNVTELIEETGLSQPNASNRLDCLFCCGLVKRERKGRFVYYEIRSKKTLQLLVAADRALSEAAEQIAMCNRYNET